MISHNYLRSDLQWFPAFRWAMFCSLILATSYVFLTDVATPNGKEIFLSCLLLTYFPASHLVFLKLLKWPNFVLATDCLALTALFHVTGGTNNPFTVLYLAHITLSLVVLGFRSSFPVILLSNLGYLSLFLVSGSPEAPAHGHAHHESMSSHLEGMFIAFFMVTSLIVLFINRILREAKRQDTLEEEKRRLQCITALTSQSAHELASPLSKAALAVSELKLTLQQDGGPHPLANQDLDIIEKSIRISRELLKKMVAVGPALTNFSFEPTSLDEIKKQLVLKWESLDVQAISKISPPPPLPREAILNSLLCLVENSYEANATRVSVTLKTDAHSFDAKVTDNGDGISVELLEKLGEPFMSSKSIGEGMGLGIFSVKLLCESLGGEVFFESEKKKGATISFSIPYGETFFSRAA